MQIVYRQIDLTSPGNPVHANWQTLLSWGDTDIRFEMPSRSPTPRKPESIQIVRSSSWLRDLVSWKAGFAVYGTGDAKTPHAMVVGRWADPESGRESSHFIMRRGLTLLFGDEALLGTDICRGYFGISEKSGLTAVTITSLSGHPIYDPPGSTERSAAARSAERAFLNLERGALEMVVDFARAERDRSERFSGIFSR